MCGKVLKTHGTPKMCKPFVTKVQPLGIFMPKETPDGLQNLHFNTLTLSPISVNWVERWSKVWVISFKGPTMCVLFTRGGKIQLGACVIVFRRAR
jgi:hypothetical protein